MIPPITHPLGRGWRQPDSSSVIVTDTHALITERVFDDLHEYSGSQPSGVYEGKMWKGEWQPLTVDGTFIHTGKWWLRWFGYSDKADCVSNNQRRILILDYHWEFEVEL